MPFIRMPSPRNAEMVISRCAACGTFVGATQNKRLLSMVEAVHRCPTKPRRKPVNKEKGASAELRKVRES